MLKSEPPPVKMTGICQMCGRHNQELSFAVFWEYMGFTCRFCGARATEVDHIKELTPDNITDRHVSLNLDNLQSLCHVCHTIKTMEDKGIVQKDCDEEYFFDENGNLSPRVLKTDPEP